MSITLNDGSVTLTLPPDLYWSDEYNWNPVEQTAQRTITGAQVVSTALRVAGRPITLAPEDDQSAWMTREMVEQLRNWAAVPGQELELTLRGTTRTVVFRHQDGSGLEARPLVHFSEMDDTDNYITTLRFMEI
jgi:hypothetical protein